MVEVVDADPAVRNAGRARFRFYREHGATPQSSRSERTVSQMEKVYEPGEIEQRLYREWEAARLLRARGHRARPTAS